MGTWDSAGSSYKQGVVTPALVDAEVILRAREVGGSYELGLGSPALSKRGLARGLWTIERFHGA